MKKSSWLYLSPAEKIIKAKLKLVKSHPFFGYPLMQIPIISSDDIKKGKIRPRGRWIQYNEKYVESLSIEELAGVLAHEILHFLLRHTQRTRELKKKIELYGRKEDRKFYLLMNIAQDIVVNAILVRNGLKLPKGGYLPMEGSNNEMYIDVEDMNGKVVRVQDPDKKSAEDVYFEIKDLEFDDSDSDGTRDDDETLSFHEEFPEEGSEEGGGGRSSGRHSKDTGGSESYSDGEEGASNGKRNVNDFMKSPEELLNEAYTYAKLQGKAPLGIERYVDEALKPKVNWKAVLRRFVTKAIPSNYTYLKPNKNSPENIFLPGVEKSQRVMGLIAIDTSGSISREELTQFISEIKWIARNYQIDIETIVCDAEVHSILRLRSQKDLEKLELKGGGGTDFTPVFDEANKRNPKFLIFFTDGYGTFPEKRPNYPVIWVVTERGAPERYFPFGRVIRMGVI